MSFFCFREAARGNMGDPGYYPPIFAPDPLPPPTVTVTAVRTAVGTAVGTAVSTAVLGGVMLQLRGWGGGRGVVMIVTTIIRKRQSLKGHGVDSLGPCKFSRDDEKIRNRPLAAL